MGAALDVRRYDSLAEAHARWDGDQQAARYEYGHGGYTGTVAELPRELPRVPDAEASTVEEARRLIGDRHEKWSTAMVVALPNGSVLVGGLCSS